MLNLFCCIFILNNVSSFIKANPEKRGSKFVFCPDMKRTNHFADEIYPKVNFLIQQGKINSAVFWSL